MVDFEEQATGRKGAGGADGSESGGVLPLGSFGGFQGVFGFGIPLLVEKGFQLLVLILLCYDYALARGLSL